MSAAHSPELAARLHARPRLCDYGDTDLAEVEAAWVIWKGRRREPVAREFLVHVASWGAYEVERFTDDAERGRELNGDRSPLIVTDIDRERGSITLTSPARLEKRKADEWPAPGLYNFNEMMKRRFPQ